MMASKKKTTRTKAKARTAKRSTTRPKAAPKRAQQKGFALRTVAPSFTVDDIERSLTWYRDVMGFAVKDRWEEDGKLMGLELTAGPIVFMIGQDDWKKGRDRVKGEGFRLYCQTDQDVDQLANGIKARGGAGSLAQEPRDEVWGARAFTVVDPDGYKITISTPIKAKR
jgi:uncharacterized glyoxalase superfamily protein PhnB